MTRAPGSTTGSHTVLSTVAPTTSVCPAPELVAAAATGQQAGVRLHALGCPVCGPMLHDHEALHALGQALGAHTALPMDRRRSLAASVLARAEAQDDALVDLQRAAPGGAVAGLAASANAPADQSATTETHEILLIAPLGDIQLALGKPRWQRWRYWQRPIAGAAGAAAAVLVAVLAVRGVTGAAPAVTAKVQVDVAVGAEAGPIPTQDRRPAPALAVDGAATVRPVGVASFQLRGDGAARQIVVEHGEVEVAGGSGVPVEIVGSNLVIYSPGARLHAVAHHGVVTSVAVFAGSVEIVVPGRQRVKVGEGQTWVWEAADPAHSLNPTVRVEGPRVPASKKSAPGAVVGSAPATATGAAAVAPLPLASAAVASAVSPFEIGFTAMRSGQWRAAATAFAKVIDDPGVGEDATYWCATALAKIGDAELSREMYGRYLERFGSGTRVGEVHVALGRLLFATDRAKARLHFDAAAKDPNPTVRAAATVELARLRQRTLREDAAGSAPPVE
ncbi:MAG: hypothetical protein KBG15_22070 [Kofleriaceae bacterium]|nr:hypothetical protein [Kofleriaceae bacterium]